MRYPAALCTILSIFSAVAPDQAFAHARLKHASPAKNASVKAGLSAIELQFNEAVEPALSVIELLDAKGGTISSSKGKAVCEKLVCRFAVDPLKAGTYAVKYHVLSEDGHTVEGQYGFTVTD